MDIEGFKKGVWVDVTNLISRVSKIQMLVDPAERDSVSLQGSPEARKGRWEGNSVTHRLKCKNSVKKDQETRILGHAEVLKAQVTLLYACKQTRMHRCM